METLQLIAEGFSLALSPTNIAFVLLGVTLGTVIGLLPGLGSATGVAILLPLTLGLDPLTALIMLAGLYYGAQYGGSITSILIATPGEASQVMTTLEGYKLARKGRAGPTLAMAAIASFVAGTLTIPLLMTLAPLLGAFALRFGPPEEFALMVFGLIAVAGLTGGDRAKGLAMAALGVALSTVGFDPQTGVPRFAFGNPNLIGGLEFVPVIIGVFAIAELLNQVNVGGAAPIRTRLRDMLPTREDFRVSTWPTIRSSFLGFFVGVLPGAGATVASFFGYDLERRISKRRRQFGTGVMEGVTAPEAANNSAVNGSFVPTLTLGIPGSATTTVILGALLLHGIRPGPFFMTEQSDIAWGLMASFYLGNVALLVLNLPMAPIFAMLLRIRYAFLYPAILVIALLGAYAVANNVFSMWVAAAFGIVGFLMLRNGYPAAPLVLGLILGGMMEQALVRTSSMAGGDYSIFLERPISLAFFLLSLLAFGAPTIIRVVRRRIRREEVTDGTT